MSGNRTLVCGGRNFKDYKLLKSTLSKFKEKYGISVIIHGGASGADSLAGLFADEEDIPVEVYKADWKKYGRPAGPIRNREMITKGRPDVVVAFKGGAGTANMIKLANSYGVFVYEIGV